MQRLISNFFYDNKLIITLFFVGILSRVPFIEKMQSHWDGPQYSIAVIRYSLEQQTPAPLGYPFYIGLGRFFYQFVGDPFMAILLISVLFSGIGAVVFYLLGKRMHNTTVGLIASVLYLSGPTFYFFGLTAYPYGMVPVIAAALALCVYQVMSKKTKHGYLLGILFSLTIAIRPQEVFSFLPLFLLGLWYLKKNEKIHALLSVVATSLVWSIPFMMLVGGLGNYTRLSKEFVASGALESPSITLLFDRLYLMAKGYFLSFTVSGFLILYYLSKVSYVKIKFKRVLVRKEVLLFACWFIPSFLSNFFIRSDHAGYQMVYLSALVVPISYAIWMLTKKDRRIVTAVVIILAFFNLWWFFRDRDPKMQFSYTPTSFHYSEIKKNDIQLSAKVAYIQKHFDPETTVLITEAQAWRPLMYHLSGFDVYNLEGLFTKSPRFMYVVNKSEGINYKQYENKELVFTVPKGINKLLFTDKGIHLGASSKREIPLSGNASITEIGVKEGQSYVYSFGSFRPVLGLSPAPTGRDE